MNGLVKAKVLSGAPSVKRLTGIRSVEMPEIGEIKKGREIGREANGYIIITLSPDSPYLPMASKKDRSIKEHRLIMAQHLGRCLSRTEMVHHKNGIKNDNRYENLELISQANHTIRTELCSQCELKKEIRLLRWQIKEQSGQIRQLTSNLMEIPQATTATIATDLDKVLNG